MTITPFAGTAFWLTTALFIAIYSFIQKREAPIWIKNSFMIAVSLGVVSYAISNSLILQSLLLLLSILVFLTGKALLSPSENSTEKKSLTWVIVIVVIFLCYFKYAIIQSYINNFAALFLQSNNSKTLASPNHHLFFMGVSYFSFKFIHFLVECSKKKIDNLTFLTFVNYILFFPSFFSGPINRYNSFAQSLATTTRTTDNLICGSKRIVTGLFKKIVLGDFLFPYSIAALNLHTATPLDIVIGIYAYGFYIYFNFSGYTDMAIGCGRMVGIELPENFNYPFFKRNLQQFWANWHMSLTSWLTDYIYWPLAKKIRNFKILRKKAVTISNISIIVTFLICGLWHGDGLNFILWGTYHGIGLAILNGYTQFIKKHTSKNVKKFVHKSPIAYGISNMITFQYVSFGFILFACNMKKIQLISNMFF